MVMNISVNYQQIRSKETLLSSDKCNHHKNVSKNCTISSL